MIVYGDVYNKILLYDGCLTTNPLPYVNRLLQVPDFPRLCPSWLSFGCELLGFGFGFGNALLGFDCDSSWLWLCLWFWLWLSLWFWLWLYRSWLWF